MAQYRWTVRDTDEERDVGTVVFPRRRLMMDEQQTTATATPSSGPSTLSVSGMASLGLGLTLHQQQDRCDADDRPGPSASSTSSVPSIDGMCNYLFHKIILFCHVFPFLV